MIFENPEKSEFWKYKKNCWKYHYFLHMCSKNFNHIWYISWDTEWDNLFFLNLPLPPPPPPPPPTPPLTTKKNKFLKKCKKKKNIWRCHHVKLVLQKTRSNDVFLLKIRSATDILSFYVIFCCFTPLLTPEIKIGEKLKKHTKKNT